MARLARLEIPQGWYHVINRGHQQRAIFRDRRCYEDFLGRLGEFPERFGVNVHTYVLLANHYHLQLELGAGASLSAAMHWLNTGYGIWFNRRYRRSGALFQGRFKAILFDPDECLLAIHYYLHLNPVRVGALKATEKERVVNKALMAKRRKALRNYELSSYLDYAGLRGPPRWLTLKTVREATRLSPAAYRRELDRRITRHQLGLDWDGELTAGVLMAGGAVLARWKRLLGKKTRNAGRSEGRRFGLVSWEEITCAIEKEWGRSWKELRVSRGSNAQAVAIWFARHRAGLTLEQVGQRLQGRSYAAIAMQVGRFQRKLSQSPVLRKQLARVARRLKVSG
jgi:REP element-mobilizing transposase RayT